MLDVTFKPEEETKKARRKVDYYDTLLTNQKSENYTKILSCRIDCSNYFCTERTNMYNDMHS
jgi:hypothetical protein